MSKKSAGSRFTHKNKPQRGVASGIHNAVVARARELNENNRRLQHILANIVQANGKPLVVDLAPIQGDWVLTMDSAPSISKDQRAIVLALVDADELRAQDAEPKS